MTTGKSEKPFALDADQLAELTVPSRGGCITYNGHHPACPNRHAPITPTADAAEIGSAIEAAKQRAPGCPCQQLLDEWRSK